MNKLLKGLNKISEKLNRKNVYTQTAILTVAGAVISLAAGCLICVAV